MKTKRIAALGVALALALSLTAVAAPAAQPRFTDLFYKNGDPHWATADINRMAEQGYAMGYTDGTYKPDNPMTAAETILFCSRVTGVDKKVQEAIAEDRAKEMQEILPTSNNINVWAAKEMAVAVETGVLSLEELAALSQEDPASVKTDADGKVTSKNYLEERMPREDICLYLVRAMQLEPLAQSLTTYPLSYSDADQISPALQPYVYVLTSFGVLKGTNLGTFDPQGSVTRAQMTTMLARGLDVMAERGISTELSEYTDYEWDGGVISAVTKAKDDTVVVTITNEISGTRSYILPNTAKVYDDNMLTTTSALKAGQYVRFNFDKKGNVTEARLSGVLSTYTGTVSSLAEDQLSILVTGMSYTFHMDRFTKISVNKEVGDRSLIDYEAGYNTATCYVDEVGHLCGVAFTGGTRLVDGLVEDIENTANGTVLSVAGFNGVIHRYVVPEGIAITVNGALGSLVPGHIGKYVTLRVDSGDAQAVSVAVDTVSTFVQGPIKRMGTVGTTRSATIYNQFSEKEETYVVHANSVITYDGQVRELKDIASGWYITALVASQIITQIDAFPATATVEGVLTGINYGATTVLEITQKDASTINYSLDITDLPAILRDGKNSSIEKLRTGDNILFTIRYNQVEKIEATSQSADLTGTITKITMETGGVTMELRFSDGSTETYSINEGVSVSQAGAASNIYNLKPGFLVDMVTNEGKVVSIDITGTASSANRLSGTVYKTSNTKKTMTVLVNDVSGKDTPIEINAENAALLDSAGKGLNLTSDSSNGYPAGSQVEVYGQYDNGTFIATIIIKQ